MSYGKLYVLNNNIKGKWIQNIIMLFNKLYCKFINKCEEYKNGIKIASESEGVIISEHMSIFFINCYLMKYEEFYDEDGLILSYLRPINIVLDEINAFKYLNEINVYNYLDAINTILNHPHFDQCKNITDINKRISIIPNLNDRYQ